MEIQIQPLTENNKRLALDIATNACVGSRSKIIRFFNKGLRNKTQNVFVATGGKQVIGVIGWYRDNGDWAGKSLGKLFPNGNDVYWVSYFAVTDALRRKGIGTQLMKNLLVEIKKKNARELWVYTSRARIFYEKMGFVFVTQALIESKSQDFLKYRFKS